MNGEVKKIKFLKFAKADYKEIQSYVVKKFSVLDWNNINDEWKLKIEALVENPSSGSKIRELEGTGFVDFRKIHHKNVYMIYSWDEKNIYVRMFVPSMRDFRTHLLKRILDQ